MSVSIIDQSTGNPTQVSGNANDKVGNLSVLSTTDKSSAVAAINEVKSTMEDLFTWKHLGSYDIAADEQKTLTISVPFNEILVYYGMPNGSEQVYGGGSVVINTGTQRVSHPCIIPYSASSSAGSTRAIAYIFQYNATQIIISSWIDTTRFAVFYR